MDIRIAPLVVAFVAAGAASMWFSSRVSTALIARHPQLWHRMNQQALFRAAVVSSFIRRREDRTLRDSDLTRKVSQARRASWMILICLALFIVVYGEALKRHYI